MEVTALIFDVISGISSAAGCILAFYIFFNFDKVKLMIKKQEDDCKDKHNQINDRFEKCLAEILKEDVSLADRSKLRQELYYVKHSFSKKLKKVVKDKIDAAIKSLDNENFNREVLCDYIDEIIALSRRNEL